MSLKPPVGSNTPAVVAQFGIDATAHGVVADGGPSTSGTDNGSAINSTIQYAKNNGVSDILLPPGIIDASNVQPGYGINLWGCGAAGDIFDTDTGFPQVFGTTLRLRTGSNTDLIKTENFDSLTGVSSPSTYLVPSRFGLHNLVLDGNKANNSSGWALKIYGRSYAIDRVIVQNGKSGGVYSEGPGGGYDMEAQWSNFRITDCGGTGLEWRGPHDSQFFNGVVARNTGQIGIHLVRGALIGGEAMTNVHCWGNGTNWKIGTTKGTFEGVTSDSGGIILSGSGNVWNGQIFGTNTPGQFAVQLGDGTAVTVGQNTIRGHISEFKGSPVVVFAQNVTSSGSRFDVTAKMGGASRYQANGGVTTLNGAVVFGATSIVVTDASVLPASSSSLYIDDGTNRSGAIAYTGKSSNTLTGVTGVPASGFASGAGVFWANDPFGFDSFAVWDYDGTTAGLLIEKATPTSQGNHSAQKTYAGSYTALDGFVMPDGTGVTGGRIFGGTGSPNGVLSKTAGDFFFRTDTPGSANQRIYVCTGTTNWTGIV